MKGFLKYLSPFAPDNSGVVSALFELGGLIAICDAGGCTGNVCGFDEPRWFTMRSAVFSTGMRDMDAILGRDKQLVEKSTTGWMEDNAAQVQYNGGAEVKIPKMTMSGLGDYDRNSGFAQGAVAVTYETRTLTQDRGRTFQLDAMDVDETNFAATAGNVM